MRKVLRCFFVIFALFLSVVVVNASEYTCKYNELKLAELSPSDPNFGDFSKGTTSSDRSITFKVTDGNVKKKNVSVVNVEGGKEEIVNWNKEKGGFSAQNYALAEACPPYMFARLNGLQWRYYVCEKAETVLELTKNTNTLYIFKLVEGPQLKDKLNEELNKELNIDSNTNIGSNEETTNVEDKEEIDYCTQCNEKGTPCGRCGYSCTTNDKGVCVTNKNFGSSESESNEAETESSISSCLDYKTPDGCKSPSVGHCTTWGCNATGPSCVWNDVSIDGKSYGYCNTDKLLYIKCGDAKDIPYQVPQIVSFAVNFLKILTPLILIFISIISLLKAISASNEDEIKKAQKGLIRKIIAAVMVFFIISIVQFVIMLVADSETKSDENDIVETENLSDCLNCFLNNKCGNSVYYKTYIGSDLTETFLSDK